MPIPYCSVHERLFDATCGAWLTWSHDYVTMVQHLGDLLDSAHIDSSHYTVTQTACDLCTTSARQAVDEPIDPLEENTAQHAHGGSYAKKVCQL
jgi:hypothetical protein